MCTSVCVRVCMWLRRVFVSCSRSQRTKQVGARQSAGRARHQRSVWRMRMRLRWRVVCLSCAFVRESVRRLQRLLRSLLVSLEFPSLTARIVRCVVRSCGASHVCRESQFVHQARDVAWRVQDEHDREVGSARVERDVHDSLHWRWCVCPRCV